MENLENSEELRNEEAAEIVVANEGNYSISDFGGIGGSSNTKTQVFTNVKNAKQLFNLENNVDCLLNDCEGETIRVKDILIKTYEKAMKEPIIDDETGEIVKDKEITMSCVIVNDEGKSYATGSKMFTIQLMRYLQMQERLQNKEETFDIKIIRKKVGDRGNKALSFELV